MGQSESSSSMLRTLPILLSFLLGSSHGDVTETVSTTSGDVIGAVVTFEGTHSNGNHKRFQGIRFAQPPVGELRFQDPQPVHPWEGVKDCSGGPPSMCPQMDFFNTDPAMAGKISGSEDCLFLNIYTRNLPSADMTSEAPLSPVLFYIHGGGFAMGAGAGIFGMNNSAEDYFMESDIVLVTINYRMLIEIETAIDESEDEDDDDDDEDEDDSEEEEISGQRRGGGRRGGQRRRQARLERRWRKLGGNRFKKLFKKKNAAKLEARKRRRLAKKLRKMME